MITPVRWNVWKLTLLLVLVTMGLTGGPALAEPAAAAPAVAQSEASRPEASRPEASRPPVVLGVAARGGGRYDNLRMCVASAAGVKGGPAMDVALRVEVPLGHAVSLSVNVPLLRPVLFGAAFHMLQLEPEVTFAFRVPVGRRVHLVTGPSLGLSLHWGPDYRSAASGDARGPSFFALGPRLGVYLGLDFLRPGKTFNFQLGLHPYVTPLFSVGDPDHHRGVVVGATLDALFRFAWVRPPRAR